MNGFSTQPERFWILHALLYFMDQSDSAVKIAAIWCIFNLTWLDAETDERNDRINILRVIGFQNKLTQLLEDPLVEIKERSKNALIHFGIPPTVPDQPTQISPVPPELEFSTNSETSLSPRPRQPASDETNPQPTRPMDITYNAPSRTTRTTLANFLADSGSTWSDVSTTTIFSPPSPSGTTSTQINRRIRYTAEPGATNRARSIFLFGSAVASAGTPGSSTTTATAPTAPEGSVESPPRIGLLARVIRESQGQRGRNIMRDSDDEEVRNHSDDDL
ncbi:hypothetical protein HK096_000501 [Nowakowskiella sp. JEL0078]|nr:hypothetical protein HK096_000501 [Nowakowskiella sp. JEL0078]